jgi:amino acid transporter
MIDKLEIITVFAGIFAFLLSGILGYLFFKAKHDLGKALGYQLLGESFILGITSGFAIAWVLWPVPLPALAQMAMRWSIFIIGGITSVNLYRTVKFIQNKED